MKQNITSVFYIHNLNMPVEFLTKSLSQFIFPFGNTGNSLFVILPGQLNRITNEFTFTFELPVCSLRKIRSGQTQFHYTPPSTFTIDNGLNAPFLSGYISPVIS